MKAWQTLVSVGLALSLAFVTNVRAEDPPQDPPVAEPAAPADPDGEPPDAEADDATLTTNEIAPAGRENPSLNPNDEKSVEEAEGLHYMVPELKNQGTTSLNEGKRTFERRFSFSPGFGQLGEQDYFVLRLAYNPNQWLGYEISLGHNPSETVHAAIHNFSVLLRVPVAFRIQPYISGGYGMLTVYPGKAFNADPVTKNAFTAGGGVEFYIREDVALRAEILAASVIGRDAEVGNNVSYSYREFTFGFSFYRSLGR